MKPVILIPWRPSDDRRQLLWDWTRYFLERTGWPVFIGDDGGKVFSRSGSMNAAAAEAGDWDVALLGDADTVQDIRALEIAAAQVMDTGGMVVPWTRRWKLSQLGTQRFGRGEPVGQKDVDRTDRTSPNGGGATLVVSRAAWDSVGGMDPYFRGYGNEDLAFVAAVETLVLQAGVPKVGGEVWHLWHKPVRFVGTARAATPENQRRWNRYAQVRWKQREMQRLVETRDAIR